MKVDRHLRNHLLFLTPLSIRYSTLSTTIASPNTDTDLCRLCHYSRQPPSTFSTSPHDDPLSSPLIPPSPQHGEIHPISGSRYAPPLSINPSIQSISLPSRIRHCPLSPDPLPLQRPLASRQHLPLLLPPADPHLPMYRLLPPHPVVSTRLLLQEILSRTDLGRIDHYMERPSGGRRTERLPLQTTP